MLHHDFSFASNNDNKILIEIKWKKKKFSLVINQNCE